MRTTLELNDEILRLAKRRAADERSSVRAVVDAALRQYLGGCRGGEGYGLRWRTEKGTLRPGVDLDDRNALHDLMDGRA